MLTTSQRTNWETNGRMVMRGSLDSAELAAVTAWVDEVEAWATQGGPGMHHFEMTDTGPALARSEDFEPHHPKLASFMRWGAPNELVEELLGESAMLFKEKVNYKQPGGAGFAPHQDASAYRFADRHVSVMVALDHATVDSGCLYFARGRFDAVLPHQSGRIDETWVADAHWEPVEACPGDLLAFDSYTPHRSGTNQSSDSRRALYLTYNAARLGSFREAYYRDKRDEFRRSGGTSASGHTRVSINDDFMGRPITG